MLFQLRQFVCIAALFSAVVFAGQEFPAKTGEAVRNGELIVRLQAAANGAAVLGSINRVPLARGNAFLLKNVPPGLAKQLAQQSAVEYVEPNRIRHATLAAPNDSSFNSQWALQTIRAVQAWALIPNRYFSASTVPAGRIRVAVIDTGVDCTHPDFRNAGGTSADSALGGQINFSLSVAYVQTTIAGAACPWMDDQGHGTHTAGIVAAATQNGTGVSSLGYPLELLIYKVLDDTGTGDDVTIANAMIRAIDSGARVISLSLGGDGYSQTLQDAVNYAWQRNVLVVAAAGNANTNTLNFPAGANHAIGVAASDQSNNRAPFSNFGSYVSIAAPGVNIISTYPTYAVATGLTNYALLSGTSMATPQVAALAGLLAGSTPNALMGAVAQRIQTSANSTYANGGWNQELGYGVIDAASALSGTLRAATAGAVTGQVTTASGVGIGGATVTLGGSTLTTADGLFRFPNLSAGTYTLRVAFAGYPDVTLPVNVTGGADTIVSAAMGVSYGQIAGTVTLGGAVQSGITVQAMSSGLVVAEASTDAQGRYSIPVTAGTYTIRAGSISDVTTVSAPVGVSAGVTAAVNLTVPREGWISGVVRDQNGNAVASLPVSITNSGFSAGAITDGFGAYSSIGLPPGTYTVQASMTGMPDAIASNVTVGADAGTTANLQFGSTTAFRPIRVNAGGGSYTDPTGNVWAADNGFNTSATYPTGSAIANTTTPILYQTERYSSSTLQYTASVPNGAYAVTLKFAEIYETGAGQRVFNIAINGSTVQTNFDVFAAAGGPNRAVDRTYDVNVTNGQIVVALIPVVSNPKISAIEIVAGTSTVSSPPPPPPPTTTFTPIRVNAGGGAVVDSAGISWAADSGYAGGSSYFSGASITNTTTPALYQSERYSTASLQYSFPVPNGTYAVNLKFAEIYLGGAGQRVFNIVINGTTVQPNFDPFAAAGGANRAVDKLFTVNVTSGQIVITLVPVISNPKISAIEITTGDANTPPPPPPTTFTPVRVNAGGGAYTDTSGTSWSADTGFVGGAAYGVGSAIANTNAPGLYQTERYASGMLQYSFTVPNSTYNVKLKFAEIYFGGAGQRVFNIVINGTTVQPNFDVLAAAGGPFIAIDRTYPVNVTTGQITISLVSVMENPKISGIEIQ
jgi:subtilisin family serine protease